VDVNLLHHLETLDHAVSPIKKPDKEPNFVSMPDAFHDKNPFKIYTLEFSMSKRFFYLLLFPDGSILQAVLFEFFCPFHQGRIDLTFCWKGYNTTTMPEPSLQKLHINFKQLDKF
jgi:hypothetical protein